MLKFGSINEYGTIEDEGRILTLTQHAYCDVDFSSQYEEIDAHGYGKLHNPPAYFAHAIDDEDNNYMIMWPVLGKFWDDQKQEYELPEDESMSCNWNIYTIRRC